MWTLPERKVRRFKVAETRLQHLRHRRKYAEGDLGDRSFFFTGPRARLNLRAQNLFLFLQLAQGLDDATWKYHLDRGDYTRWFAEGVKNAELAADADAVRKARLGQGDSRDRIREAIEKHYTLPAPSKAAIEMPPRKARHQGSMRRKAAEKAKTLRRRVHVDPVQLLKHDHMIVQELFGQFEAAKDTPERMRPIAEKAILELQIHERIEEEIFYPAMRSAEETKEIVSEAEEEHHVVDLLIGEILKMKPQDEHYHAKFTVMAENVRHHIREEEDEMLPKARDLLGGRYEQVGDQMKKRKDELTKEFGGKPKAPTAARSAGPAKRSSVASRKTAKTSGRKSSATTTSRARTGSR
jgi:hypothetical protein